ncbi:outer envelope pore protein 24A, chloroplastic-like [Ipomoea triloba]|uniref:outer envelope pore protein 24A, chloroplastic-like n=1 Tax=Ipomoea triloba TaxID=35885 RepID=UPI00125D6A23|nr:outer envelope pore protein 24A, chloroplastic-like [Ipomoea triloba]
MIRTSLTGRYDNGASGAVASATLNAGDFELKGKTTFINGPSFEDLSLLVEKPGSFVIDYNVPKKDVKFQFMNTARVLEKQLNLTYSHWRGDNRTALDGTLVIDSSNKLSANYELNSRNCKVKYSYMYGGLLTLEPSYDFGKNSWDVAVSRRVLDDDVVRASCQSSSKVLELDWCRNTSINGSFKVSASINLADPLKTPTFSVESRLNFGV